MRTKHGELLLNGHVIRGLPPEADAALRFCLSRFRGSAGHAFELHDVPGSQASASSVVQLLLDFDGLELLEELPLVSSEGNRRVKRTEVDGCQMDSKSTGSPF